MLMLASEYKPSAIIEAIESRAVAHSEWSARKRQWTHEKHRRQIAKKSQRHNRMFH